MTHKDAILGIDIGGTGIKGALVDIQQGKLITERFRLDTPSPANIPAVVATFKEVVQHFEWTGHIGCGFPSVIKQGKSFTASNIHQDWIGAEVENILSTASGCTVNVRNDADVAGIAEMRFGEGRGQQGVTVVITIGTGLGSAVFVDDQLLPNIELGQLYLKAHHKIVEHYAANSIRKKEELLWESWAMRFNEFLQLVITIFNPRLIILGGGASKKFELFGSFLEVSVPIRPAQLLNEAGIIGAAMYAYECQQTPIV